jgi:hypothetical protein
MDSFAQALGNRLIPDVRTNADQTFLTLNLNSLDGI